MVVPTMHPIPYPGPAVPHGPPGTLMYLIWSDFLCPQQLWVLVAEPGGNGLTRRPCLAVCVGGHSLLWLGCSCPAQIQQTQPSLLSEAASLVTLGRGPSLLGLSFLSPQIFRF